MTNGYEERAYNDPAGYCELLEELRIKTMRNITHIAENGITGDIEESAKLYENIKLSLEKVDSSKIPEERFQGLEDITRYKVKQITDSCLVLITKFLIEFKTSNIQKQKFNLQLDGLKSRHGTCEV